MQNNIKEHTHPKIRKKDSHRSWPYDVHEVSHNPSRSNVCADASTSPSTNVSPYFHSRHDPRLSTNTHTWARPIGYWPKQRMCIEAISRSRRSHTKSPSDLRSEFSEDTPTQVLQTHWLEMRAPCQTAGRSTSEVVVRYRKTTSTIFPYTFLLFFVFGLSHLSFFCSLHYEHC